VRRGRERGWRGSQELLLCMLLVAAVLVSLCSQPESKA
jgi:hypothetical protein